MNEPGTSVTIDENGFKELKETYAAAVEDGETEFYFEGNLYVVSYAKYLIEYLEEKFS